MDMKTQSVPNLAYEDFEPEFQWERDESSATLVVLLPEFRKEQLKVQVTSTPLVKIIGERQINGNKRRRINKEFSIPSDCDANEVTARFERGRLNIRFSLKASSKPQEDSSKPTEERKPSNEVSEQKETPQKDKESPKKEEGKREGKKKKKVATGGVAEGISEATTSKNGENLGLIERTKTRVLDYTISLKPSYTSEDFKKPKKLVNLILVVLSVVVLGIYVKNALRSFLGGESKFEG